ncbi:MAG TPA: S8 family serine peptidase [Tepidisphaeraceae bacterium]
MPCRTPVRPDRPARLLPEYLEARVLFSLPPGLNGSGVPVAQAEAEVGPGEFEVNPSAVNQPASLFTYTSSAGSVTGVPPPNAAGAESYHADAVGQIFYGNGTSIAPGVSHVDNYEADYFINNVIDGLAPIAAKVINQSFVATDQNGTPIEDPATDQAYDNYIARFNKIIVSSAGNGGMPDSPSTAYNDISVGSSDFPVSVGPTADGRSKPDISAPGSATSFTAPQVAAAAAVLLQATHQDLPWWSGFGASDERTIKALLLNGADKPAGWTHTPTMPLDPRYGAGAVDAANAVQELDAGRALLDIPTWSPLGGTHAPLNLHGLFSNKPSGWDFGAIASSPKLDAVNHYLFTVSGSSTLTATLVWNRQFNQSTINNLDLNLYNVDTHALVAQSISGVDNVEELYMTGLPAGHYDIEVLKHGGTPGVTPGDVSNTELYSLAFNFARGSTAPTTGGIQLAFGSLPASSAILSPPAGTATRFVPSGSFVTAPADSIGTTAANAVVSGTHSTVTLSSATDGTGRSPDASMSPFADGLLASELA